MKPCKLSRRAFVRAGGSAGALLVFGLRTGPGEAAPAVVLAPSLFVSMDARGAVFITVSRGEMGQGVRTVLPRILADELEADLERVDIVQALADPRYGDQNTDSSRSVRMLWGPLRQAGAAAREMLVHAAADYW